MNKHKASSLLFMVAFLLSSSVATAFNITKLLGNFPDFSNLNDLFTQTKLNDQINSRQTITVLAVNNAGLSGLSGKPLDLVKKVLSAHVILDYYDVQKITELGVSNKTTTLTTLFQASGGAVNQQGFINIALINEGEIAFGSAVKGAKMDSKLVKMVASQPYNISVLQITQPISIPGIDSSPSSQRPSAAPVPAPKKSPATAPAPSKKSRAPTPAPSKKSDSPAPSDEAEAPASLSDAPTAEAPASDAPAPAADTPVSDGPVSDSPASSPAADAAPKASGASRSEMMVGAGMMTTLMAYIMCL
ncbi:hypothetical protein FNV43_RR12818 [Rhamnella rubrinervis]|uniref:FAS1 domain-containing protein n=1 Tax=Rhamnella rubrinervis TaxID=2594499 RepID=A0A8K0H806_9ROSA|nr:hypothetical protein FNV43_RR12818 [Rhamnella rubrinervis]